MFNIYRSQEAVSPLRNAWEEADDALREAICRASDKVDKRLSENPLDQGESRDEKSRILFQPPVAILFDVDKDIKLVRVLRAWAYRTHREQSGSAE